MGLAEPVCNSTVILTVLDSPRPAEGLQIAETSEIQIVLSHPDPVMLLLAV